MQIARLQIGLLLTMAVGLTPIALAYGVAPMASLPWLYGIEARDVPIRHVFRAIMGLYLALICFWAAGALSSALRLPAIWSLFVFTLGLGLGRSLSMVVDGWPGLLLAIYLLVEFAVAACAAWLIARGGGRDAHA